MPPRSRRTFWKWSVVTAFLLLTAAIPVAKVVMPAFHRWQMLGKLTSADPDIRAAGHAYVISKARDNEPILRGAIERLAVEDEQIFIELVLALDQAGVWTVDRIPREHWLRFLAHMARDREPEARLLAGQMLADLPDSADDGRVITLFKTLLGDTSPDVRFNALVCAAEMRGAAVARKVDRQQVRDYDALIADRTRDEKPMITRHAWMFLGLINDPANGMSASWRDAPPDVAEAILWMALHTNPDVPQPAIEALGDATVPPQVRAMAATMLGRSATPEARAALTKTLEIAKADITTQNQIVLWRTILAMPLAKRTAAVVSPAPEDPGYAALLRFFSQFKREDYENVTLRPLILACIHRDRQLLIDAGKAGSDIFTIADDPVAWLAALEGAAEAVAQGRVKAGRVPIPVDPPQLRLASLRASDSFDPAQLLPLLANERETIRNQACVLAAQRLTNEQNAGLIRRLMQPPTAQPTDLDQIIYRFYDEAKQSAALLAGMTGADDDALHQMWRDFGDRRGVREVIQLALFMRDLPVPDATDMGELANKAMMVDAMPRHTILLALLHKGHPLALDTLLTPRGDPRPDLLKLLDQDRWWFVLEHYLPKEAPRLSVWADPDLARFQLELLRDWYVLNRRGAIIPK